MQELEKILEEIELEKKRLVFYPDCSSAFSAVQIRTIEKIEQIICKYMSIGKHINDGWILVEDRLPDNSEDVLVTTDVGLITFGYLLNGKWITNQEPDYPIAWRTLPEPYRPERSDNHDGE